MKKHILLLALTAIMMASTAQPLSANKAALTGGGTVGLAGFGYGLVSAWREMRALEAKLAGTPSDEGSTAYRKARQNFLELREKLGDARIRMFLFALGALASGFVLKKGLTSEETAQTAPSGLISAEVVARRAETREQEERANEQFARHMQEIFDHNNHQARAEAKSQQRHSQLSSLEQQLRNLEQESAKMYATNKKALRRRAQDIPSIIAESTALANAQADLERARAKEARRDGESRRAQAEIDAMVRSVKSHLQARQGEASAAPSPATSSPSAATATPLNPAQETKTRQTEDRKRAPQADQ